MPPTSLTLFNMAGIPVKVHWTFWFLVLWAGVMGYTWLDGWVGAMILVMAVLFLFASVVAHELGHALAAQGMGLKPKNVILYPFGGMANIPNLAQNPWTELAIAVAGPAINLILSLVLLWLFLLFWSVEFAAQLLAEPRHLLLWVRESALTGDIALVVVVYLAMVNFLLAVFNLLPAFPMDGGRILRAGLGFYISFQQATRLATRLGQALALVTIFFTVTPYFYIYSPSSAFIAIFVFWGASYEDRLVQKRGFQHELSVSQVDFARNVKPVLPEQSVSEAVERMLKGPHLDFPVVGLQGLIGMLKRDDLLRALHRGEVHLPVSQLMCTDYPRVSLHDNLQTVQQYMIASKLTTLPVFDGSALVGLINVRDVSP